LKPANLFVIAGSDGLPFVKVLDFGISKTVATEGADLSVTSSASILGSPLYMSPEQLSASKDVDRRSDVWSLGIILYEALTGRTPFMGASFAMVGAQILLGKFDPISKVRPGLPPAIDTVIASMLTADRATRMQSVEAFAKQVAPLGTKMARTSAERIARIAGRPAASSEGGNASASTPTLFGDTAEIPVDAAPAVTQDPGPSRPHRRVAVIAGMGLVGGALLATAGWAAFRRAPAPPAPVPVVVIASSVAPAQAPSAPPPPAETASASAPSVAASGEVAHAPAPTSRPAKPASKAESLTRAFARREADIAHCFDSQGADLPGSPKIAIRFTVDVEGHVKAAQVSPPEVASTPLGQCLADVAKGTQFGAQAEEVSFKIPIAARRGT
jgi:serine/threonine-protein kinase